VRSAAWCFSDAKSGRLRRSGTTSSQLSRCFVTDEGIIEIVGLDESMNHVGCRSLKHDLSPRVFSEVGQSDIGSLIYGSLTYVREHAPDFGENTCRILVGG
jgi:hypothetical protein